MRRRGRLRGRPPIAASMLLPMLLPMLPPMEASALAAERAAFDAVPGAAAGREIWLAVPDPEKARRTQVLHLASDRDPPTVRVATVLDGEVEAIAAADRRAWVVLAPRAGTTPRREVVTLETARNPASGLDYSWPREGPVLLPSLPGRGRLLDFAADLRGPWALLTAPPARGGDADARTLLRLERGGRWQEVPPPEGGGVPFAFAAAEHPGGGLLLLGEDPADPSITIATPIGGSDGEAPPTRRWAVPPAQIAAAAAADGATLLAIRPEMGRFELIYPRPQASLRLAELPPPSGPFLLAGTANGPRLLEAGRDGVRIRRIDPISGEASEWQTPSPPSLGMGTWLHLPLLGMLAVTAVLALVLFRPLKDPDLWTLPPPWRPLPPLPRVAALAIDALPGTLLAMAWFGVGPADLALLPAWSLDAERAIPSAAAIGLTVLWCTAWEALGGGTPGKRLVGATVRGGDGEPPTLRATLLRNLLKGVLLYAPVLAIFTLLDANGRGIGEVLSRTAVVRRDAAAAEDAEDAADGKS